MTGADAIVRCLELEKVSYVFGYPGVAICPFFDSLESTDIESILVRTEQNAAHEANGYARISGKPGVCAVTSGPGATNVITGIATAFADSIPLIVITGQVESRLLGSDVFQEADICGASESFVKYSYTLRNAEEIPKVFKEAFHIAMTGRKGPVLIDIPIDVQKASLRKFQYPDDLKMRTYKPTVQGNPVQIKRLFQRLENVKKPILCVGGGVHLAGVSEKVREFSHKFNIPVVSTMMGLGTMQDIDPLYFGMVGNNGRSYGNKAMNRAELIIMMGARVADRSISQPDLITENKTLVHIDVDPAEIGKNAGPEIPLVGDLSSVLDSLLHVEAELSYPDWMEELNGIKEETELLIEKKKKEELNATLVNPYYFLRELNLALQDDAIYVADVGQNQLWSCKHYKMKEGRFLTSGGMGTMGYSLPAAIGAYFAEKEIACLEDRKNKKEIIAVMGDGAFQMSLMELATLRQYSAGVKIIVFHNGVLGLVRQYQKTAYKEHYSMIDLSGNPDLSMLSKAYGLSYFSVKENKEVKESIRAFLDKEENGILEVFVDMEETA
ncbi:acetolactate synthase, large subunit, biosynthetic type [Oribacterium parvum ACB1]|uniref:Acetolactate synthase n=1 Tax=Oribacterium parvum ACB1 TaxID=796943 RepID=G9WME6_9FIRM|nr:biosynthetic-type acetolactate synthase large subunit [Oribacterium parvum]EHL11699.1 acetolactate synthase, large subunit, biosynthetic type [Oribacterium parvum ACB1]EJF13328.1 acetolactate synthase, large subunit, biosynthetic type [Oribacterium parvum ACB8]